MYIYQDELYEMQEVQPYHLSKEINEKNTKKDIVNNFGTIYIMLMTEVMVQTTWFFKSNMDFQKSK